MPIMSFAEYARHRECSRAYISKRKSEGVLDKAIVKKNGREKIDSKKADKILGESSDPNFTKGSDPNFTKGSPADQTKALSKKAAPKKKSRATEPLEPEDAKDQSFIQARTWSERYRAADRKLAFEIKSGKWIEKAVVRDQGFRAARLCRDGLLNIPARIVPLIIGEKDTNKAMELATKEINEVLGELVRQLSMMGD
jgi:hypothetical protein